MKKGRLTKEHILQHAFSIASESGLESLSFGSLAQKCDMSKSGLYAHFQSKQKLQLDVIHYTNQVFAQRVIEPVREKQLASYRQKIAQLFELWLDWNHSFQGRCMYLDAWNDTQKENDPLQQALKESVSIWIDYLSIQLTKAQQCGELKPEVSPKQAAFELYSFYLGANLFYSLHGQDQSREHFWHSVNSRLNVWLTTESSTSATNTSDGHQ
ncbi:TetR/AcrR family transcriptional regulator [Vibrio maerlii]|uniref:TetR/AcrR family transcriptional regulator n=1 Tax=Vibrio maerlii TaxID=2231648 RepID=UPI000E3D3B8C|nr:TetR/AcrR family transcriptional regulator [Vibrio maerlii]